MNLLHDLIKEKMIEGDEQQEKFNGRKGENNYHANVKILLVEDNSDIRENITEILELDGYNVLIASGGKSGVELAMQQLPDVILCDIVMPELSGYEVLKQLKANKDTAHILFLFVTASVGKKEVEAALEMGADGYIFKPFGLQELLNEIEQCLQRRRSANA